MRRACVPTLLLIAVLLTAPALGANITINNVDPPGVGFNDPTPVDSVGGNPGTTLGEQRVNVFRLAADLWGSVLESEVDIVVQATFNPASTFFGPLPCGPVSGTLGAAATIQIFANFPGAELLDHWYHSALANSLAGFDQSPGPPDPGFLAPPFADDLFALFNDNIDSDPNCLTGVNWYYGYDNKAGTNANLLNVLLHEFSHGLGFSEFISENTGEGPVGLPDVFSAFVHDNTLGLNWNAMTPAERLASQVNTGNLVWDGPEVTAAAPTVLDNKAVLNVVFPRRLRNKIDAQPATFGPPLRSCLLNLRRGGGWFTTRGLVRLVNDGIGEINDGCELPVNRLRGKLALVDRGGCGFTQKVANAEAVGARGVIVANNIPDGLPPMGGDDSNIRISSVGISQADGNAIKATLPFVFTELCRDPNSLAGADDGGRVRLYAPNPVEPGSSIAHWDTTASPDLLMEPFLQPDVRGSEDLDLTPVLFLDIGWSLSP
jgi:hypothetical protein